MTSTSRLYGQYLIDPTSGNQERQSCIRDGIRILTVSIEYVLLIRVLITIPGIAEATDPFGRCMSYAAGKLEATVFLSFLANR
jgi:hypothetical protein